MMPRPLLREQFGLTYRKIPVLAIGRELYCDTSIICEALEHFFPQSEGFQSLYPAAQDGRTYRSLIRGFASYWTDRPLFRVTTGLMPASIWRSSFGVDRAQLIGHKLDPEKLEKKLPENLARLDLQLSLFEPLFAETDGPWIFSTSSPSLADISVYYQLLWGEEISSGRYSNNISEGELRDENTGEIMAQVFNAQRYPGVHAWYRRMRAYFDELPAVEDKKTSVESVLEQMKKSPALGSKSLLLPTLRSSHADLDAKTGLQDGAQVSIVPDDTGREEKVFPKIWHRLTFADCSISPTIGTLLAMSPEEVVIKPRTLDKPANVDCRMHFPRIGFVVRPVKQASL